MNTFRDDYGEAIEWIEGVLPKLQSEARGSISALVEPCRAQLGTAAPTFAMH